MLHGRKKQEKQEMTPEQKKEIDDKLQKILTINNTLLKKRANKEYDSASLEQTEKFSFLSPDFQTLWNYRREIITHIFQNELKEDLDKKYEMVIKELEFLVKGITRSPKSYTLWYQRQWIIDKGLEIERQKLGNQAEQKEWKSRVLETELKLCDKMLMMDERNFHCWNYRLMIAQSYLKEIQLRVTEGFRAIQKQFLEKECLMAENLIKKNFSNYSAWNYRSKLMPVLFEDEKDRIYLIPFSKIQEDLSLLKHAFFTDPKDQSPWNYHEWLISLISPVQIVSLSIEQKGDEAYIVLGLSHKVRSFQSLDIQLLGDNGAPLVGQLQVSPHKTSKSISSSWEILIPQSIQNNFSLSIKQQNTSDFKTIDEITIFRDLFVHMDLQKKTFQLPAAEIWIRDDTFIDNLAQVIDQDIANLKELIDFEKGLRFAVQRLKDLIMLKYEYLANPYYLNTVQMDATNDTAKEIEDLTQNLKEIDGKSHNGLHEKLLRSFSHVKNRWERVYESGTLELAIITADQNEMADRHFGFFAC